MQRAQLLLLQAAPRTGRRRRSDEDRTAERASSDEIDVLFNRRAGILLEGCGAAICRWFQGLGYGGGKIRLEKIIEPKVAGSLYEILDVAGRVVRRQEFAQDIG